MTTTTGDDGRLDRWERRTGRPLTVAARVFLRHDRRVLTRGKQGHWFAVTVLCGVVLLVTGCGDGGKAGTGSTVTVTASHSTSAPPSLSALDTVACQQAEAAMARPDDTIAYLRSGMTTAAFLIASAFTSGAEGVETSADAATDPELKSALENLASANTLAAAKADAWRSGTLELAYEIEAVEQAHEAVADLCG